MNASQTSPLRFVLFATGVTAIGGFLFGYDTAVINGANSYLAAHMGLDATQEGLAGASAILGCIPGAMLAGFMSDRFGRKKMLFFCAILYAISGLLSAIPDNFGQFLTARIISGLGIGASSMICPVYIAEIAPDKWRGRLGTLFQLGIVIGIFMTLFVNKFIQGIGDVAWNTATGWRWMLGMEAVPAVVFIGLLFAVPESPRWLVQNGYVSEARGILLEVGGTIHASKEMMAISEAMMHEKGRFSELFSGIYARPLLIAVMLALFQQFCGINAIMYYSTKIFATAGSSTDAAFTSSVWIGFINVIFTFVAISFVDKSGRRPLLLVGTAVQSIALGSAGWMLHSGQQGVLLLLCVILFVAAFSMSMGPITWLLCSEIFPNKLRGRAMSLTTFVIWSACYVVAQTFPMMNGSVAIGPAGTFWIYGGVSLISFLFVYLFIPETKGHSLEEIEKLWSNPESISRL